MIFVVTIGDIFGIAVGSLALLALLYVWIAAALREGRCKHDGTVSETQACDAICDKCGKNLGFIGAWQKRQPN